MSRCLTIIGVQWGDEGKGKITDLLAGNATHVVRYQGGANAGHTVVVGGRKIILHQVPSGILSPGVLCVIGPSVVVDPETLLDELDMLGEAGIDVGPDRIAISRSASAVLPYHKRLDALRENSRGKGRIGTTGRGIGPAYEDLFGRTAIRLSDLCDPDSLAAALDRVLPERNALLAHYGGETIDASFLVDSFRHAGRRLAPYLRDTGAILHDAIESPTGRVLLESAQGTLLDILHGTYPFVTSSLTTGPAAFPLLGIGIPANREVLATVKAYATRVGSGPFPTEDTAELGNHLRDLGGEYGSTTGRPRRCGPLDLPLLRYAMRVNGVTGLAITKLDVLRDLDPIPVCVAYDTPEGRVEWVHPENLARPGVVPVYEQWPGWLSDIRGARSIDQLPPTARDYVDRISRALSVPIRLVSTGCDRDDTISFSDPWEPRAAVL
jgi:adenylosuccinate synthase